MWSAIRPTYMTTEPYLAKLNPEQRRAVEHGIRNPSPLLIIAGAGTGKTNTLAHRVAHLIMQGSDPRRIMLLTFSRRAAVEMIRRVERIAAHVLPNQPRLVADGLTWSGTFHAIGARVLREYAEHIGLDRVFTIHDREDSADLMNLVRHDLGFSKTEERFPAKSTCLAIYSRASSELSSEYICPPSYPQAIRPSCARNSSVSSDCKAKSATELEVLRPRLRISATNCRSRYGKVAQKPVASTCAKVCSG